MHEKMAGFLVLPRIFNQTLHTDEISQEDDQNVIKIKDKRALFQVSMLTNTATRSLWQDEPHAAQLN